MLTKTIEISNNKMILKILKILAARNLPNT